MGVEVDSDDLIGAAEVAAILRLSHPSSVTTYLRRYPGLPAPVVDLPASRVRLWRRQDIERWQRKRTPFMTATRSSRRRSEWRRDHEPHHRRPSAAAAARQESARERPAVDYERAVLDDNVLGKDTVGVATADAALPARALSPPPRLAAVPGALRPVERRSGGQPLLAGLCALARDPVFRASAPAIFDSEPGDEVTSADLADAVAKTFPDVVQRGDAGEDRPEHVLVVGADRPPRSRRPDHEGPSTSGVHAVDDRVRAVARASRGRRGRSAVRHGLGARA